MLKVLLYGYYNSLSLRGVYLSRHLASVDFPVRFGFEWEICSYTFCKHSDLEAANNSFWDLFA